MSFFISDSIKNIVDEKELFDDVIDEVPLFNLSFKVKDINFQIEKINDKKIKIALDENDINLFFKNFIEKENNEILILTYNKVYKIINSKDLYIYSIRNKNNSVLIVTLKYQGE